jgi:Tfp pilus assembly protein PilX
VEEAIKSKEVSLAEALQNAYEHEVALKASSTSLAEVKAAQELSEKALQNAEHQIQQLNDDVTSMKERHAAEISSLRGELDRAQEELSVSKAIGATHTSADVDREIEAVRRCCLLITRTTKIYLI